MLRHPYRAPPPLTGTLARSPLNRRPLSALSTFNSRPAPASSSVLPPDRIFPPADSLCNSDCGHNCNCFSAYEMLYRFLKNTRAWDPRPGRARGPNEVQEAQPNTSASDNLRDSDRSEGKAFGLKLVEPGKD